MEFSKHIEYYLSLKSFAQVKFSETMPYERESNQ